MNTFTDTKPGMDPNTINAPLLISTTGHDGKLSRLTPDHTQANTIQAPSAPSAPNASSP